MKHLLPFLALYKHFWLRIAVGVILAIITLLASIGLLTLSGWFLAGTAIAGITGGYFNYVLPAAGVRGSAIFRTFSRYVERLVSHDTTFRVLAKLRVFTFSKLLPLTPSGIARFKQSELLNRLVADVDILDHLYLKLISPVTSALIVVMIVTTGLAYFDATLALTLGGILLALIIVTPFIFYAMGAPTGVALAMLQSQYRGSLNAWLQGNAELTIFNAIDRFRAQLDSVEIQWQQAQGRQASQMGIAQGFVILVSGLTTVLILWLAADGVGYRESADPFVALFAFASLAAFETVAPIAGAFLQLSQVTTAAKRIDQLVSQKPDINFPTEDASVLTDEISLEVNHLSFRYPGQPNFVLNDVSLKAKHGEHIAILGKTGCGKSTLLQLITRALDPTQGEISLSAIALPNLTEESLRTRISVVPQRVHIFSATIRDNLTLARADATDEQLTEVLTHVGLTYLLENELGLMQWLGEGGRQLSGGEQRRIGIARALLHTGSLILLDEPTEGLDAATEQSILQILHQHSKNKTLVMVTHRLTQLEKMDKIVVMDAGHVVESGSHDELLAQKGVYFQFMSH